MQNEDVSDSLNILIWYIWGLAEMKYDIDFVECISEGVKHRVATQRVAS